MCPPPPFPIPLPCLPSSFRMCLLFPLFILPLLLYFYFISAICNPLNHIFLLLVSCCHYFYSTACTCKPLLSLYHSRSPASFLLFFPGFVVAINIFLWLIRPSLFLTFFPFLTLFLLSYSIPHLFAPFFPVLFVITCTTFLPFPSFSFIILLSNATSLMLTLQYLYCFYLFSILHLFVTF